MTSQLFPLFQTLCQLRPRLDMLIYITSRDQAVIPAMLTFLPPVTRQYSAEVRILTAPALAAVASWLAICCQCQRRHFCRQRQVSVASSTAIDLKPPAEITTVDTAQAQWGRRRRQRLPQPVTAI
jgi:hypothetical protein